MQFYAFLNSLPLFSVHYVKLKSVRNLDAGFIFCIKKYIKLPQKNSSPTYPLKAGGG